MEVAAASLRYGKRHSGLLALAYAMTALGDTPIVYRCGGEQVVYSDRPCGADANPHVVDDSRVTVYEAPPPSTHAPTAASKKPLRRPARTGRKAATSSEQRRAKCNKLDQSLRDLRAKMRSGYGVEEGERLKARQRQLAQQRRLEKCR